MDAGESLERVYRGEATRIRAALAARSGDVGVAEDAVQDALVEAIEHWPRDGVPANPAGWLATTARRKAVDRLRRVKSGEDKLALLAVTEAWALPDNAGEVAQAGCAEPDQMADDELLGLVFASCHPALTQEAQVALTLRAVCGLSAGQIASPFLVSQPPLTHRLPPARHTLSQPAPP